MKIRPFSGRSGWLKLLALLLAFVLVAAACGSDDDEGASDDGSTDSADTDGGDTDGGDTDGGDTDGGDTDGGDTDGGDTDGGDTDGTDGTSAGVEGCGDGASTDPADLSVGRAVARCEPGTPAPMPLEETTTIRMSSSFRLEFIAPILLAEEFGEFEAENIDFEFVNLSFSDALPQLGIGDLDAAVGGTEAAFHNAIANDFNVKWTIGNFFPPDAGDRSVPQTGLWARSDVFSDPSNPDVTELEGTTLASAVGLGSVIAYPIGQAFTNAGLSLADDLSIETIPSAEMLIALENDSVQSAWLLDGVWPGAAEQPDDFVLVETQPPGEPLGGLYFGPSLLEDNREAGVAFLRAIIRTINTYLDGDYKDDPDVVAAIARVLEQDEEAVGSSPELLFDWEIREGTSTRAQELFISFGTVEYDTPIPEDQVVDRSFYLEAVGQG